MKSVDCLIAEDNPISSKVLETILVRLGCRCVVVHNGEEVIRCTMGELVFDVIFVRVPQEPWHRQVLIAEADGHDDADLGRRKRRSHDQVDQKRQPRHADRSSHVI